MQRRIRRAVRFFSAVTLAACLFTSGASAAEQTAESPGTKVWISAVPRPTMEHISVTLPTVVAFVVNGTVDTKDQNAVSMENGTILVPNVKVEAEADNQYTLIVEGSSTLVVRNYSTDVPKGYEDEPNPLRVGIGVTITGTVKSSLQESTPENPQWTPVGAAPPVTQEGFKQYLLAFDGKKFTKAVSGGFQMEQGIDIGAPPAETGGWTAGGVSRFPFEQEIALGVEVGGTRGMYNKAETSVKAAQVTWQIKSIPLEDTP